MSAGLLHRINGVACVTRNEVVPLLVANVVAPLYAAEIEYVPGVMLHVDTVAIPALKVAVPSEIDPEFAEKLTVPAGDPDELATFAVRVTH